MGTLENGKEGTIEMLWFILNLPLISSYTIYQNNGDRTTELDGVLLPLFNIEWNNLTEGITTEQKMQMFREWKEKTVAQVHMEGKTHSADYVKEMACYPGPAINSTGETGLARIPLCSNFSQFVKDTLNETGEFLTELERSNQSLASSELNVVQTFEKELAKIQMIKSSLPTVSGELGSKVDELIAKSRKMINGLSTKELMMLNEKLPKQGQLETGFNITTPDSNRWYNGSTSRQRRPHAPRFNVHSLCKMSKQLNQTSNETISTINQFLAQFSVSASNKSDQETLCDFASEVKDVLPVLDGSEFNASVLSKSMEIGWKLCNSTTNETKLPLPARLLANTLRTGNVDVNKLLLLCKNSIGVENGTSGQVNETRDWSDMFHQLESVFQSGGTWANKSKEALGSANISFPAMNWMEKKENWTKPSFSRSPENLPLYNNSAFSGTTPSFNKLAELLQNRTNVASVLKSVTNATGTSVNEIVSDLKKETSTGNSPIGQLLNQIDTESIPETIKDTVGNINLGQLVNAFKDVDFDTLIKNGV